MFFIADEVSEEEVDPFTAAERKIRPAYQKEIERDILADIASFIWHYGNDTFKDGDVGFLYFAFLSRQIPSLEAKATLMVTEGAAFAYGGTSTPQSKKRLKQLHTMAIQGI